VEVGDTVSLRVDTGSGPIEVVGVVLRTGSGHLVVRRRDGSPVEIDVDTVTAGRVVPPGPERRIDVQSLQGIAGRGWPGAETAHVGEWELRASQGFTGRANAVLPLGDPGLPLAEAVDAVRGWYAERGLPPRMLVPVAPPTPLTSLLDEQGWSTSPPVHVMTAAIGPALRGADDDVDVEVRIDATPDEEWLAALRQEARSGQPLPAAARAVLTGPPVVAFASIRGADGVHAIARVAVDGRWAGLFCVEVDPARRRRGLAAAVSRGALRWAVAQGARWSYLQVSSDNPPARGLYAGMGYAMHHDYVHRFVDGSR
jgi:ribosomal protein S18 acetylase RimI-like enzyme